MVQRSTHPAPACLSALAAGKKMGREGMQMLEIIGLLYYLAIFSGALLIGGSIVAIWEAIAREWE